MEARHEDDQDEAQLSLVHGDAPFRLQRTLGLILASSALYQAVESMRPAPIGKRALVSILLPALLPLLAAASIQIPINSMLLKILSTLA